MRRLRWAVDGGGWELDVEAPVTMEGIARAVPGVLLPLGLSRGGRLSRSNQLDFLHRFMASPFVPSFSGDPTNGGQGFLLHHAHSFHIRDNWYSYHISFLSRLCFLLLVFGQYLTFWRVLHFSSVGLFGGFMV